MPTVVKFKGYSVRVYTRDEHPSAHVHVEKAGSVIKVIMGENEVEDHSYKGDKPSAAAMGRATQIVADNLLLDHLEEVPFMIATRINIADPDALEERQRLAR